MAPDACMLSPSGDVEQWQKDRRRQGLPSWPDVVPPAGPATEVRRSSDGKWLLLTEGRLLALFATPERGGGLVGLLDRRFAADLLRPSEDSLAAAFEICRGGRGTNPSDCDPGGKLVRPRQVRAGWSTETVDGHVGLSMHWRDVDGTDVQTHYQFRNGTLHARISARDLGRDPEEGIVHVRFPVLSGTARGIRGGVKLVLPRFNLGLICDDCRGATEYYPRHFQPMPWFGYLEGNHGLYVGAHDARGRLKRVKAAGPAAPGESWFELYPEYSGSAANAVDMDWWTVIAPVCADRGWPTLTYHYRRWVTSETPWGRTDPLYQRSHPPADFREGVWWFNHSIGVEDSVERLAARSTRAHRQILGGTAHAWYSWTTAGMNRGFPAFDPKPGTREAIAKVQQEGAWILPYINAGLTDQSSAPDAPPGCDKSFSHYPELWDGAVVLPGGKRPVRKAESGACLVRMDPSHPGWRQAVGEAARRVFSGLGARGIYFDVIGNVQPGSWDTGRHPPGRGSWVTRKERTLLASARPRGAIVAVEGALEQMIGTADVGLHYLKTPVSIAPLFMAVYHDRTLLGGMGASPEDDRAAFSIKSGLATVWGLQPGLTNLRLRKAEGRFRRDLANQLLNARRRLRDWLVYGEFIAPLRPIRGAGSTSLFSESWCEARTACEPVRFERPAIEAVWYRSPAGEDRVVFVNMGGAAGRLVAEMPWSLAHLDPVIYEVSGKRVSAAERTADRKGLVLEAPAYTVRSVAFEAAGSVREVGADE